jgi:hypothetical protein
MVRSLLQIPSSFYTVLLLTLLLQQGLRVWWRFHESLLSSRMTTRGYRSLKHTSERNDKAFLQKWHAATTKQLMLMLMPEAPRLKTMNLGGRYAACWKNASSWLIQCMLEKQNDVIADQMKTEFMEEIQLDKIVEA